MAHPDPYASDSKRKWIALGAGAATLVILLIAGIGFGLLGIGRSAPPTVLPKVAQTAPVLPKTAEPAPVLPKAPEVAQGMPDDVRRWLEHLERIERRRRDMSGGQVGELLAMMTRMQTAPIRDMLPGAMGTGEETGENTMRAAEDLQLNTARKREEWDSLRQDFLSLPPPPDCAPIQAEYNQVLTETGTMMTEIMDAVSMASENPDAALSALTRMKGTSGGRIDNAAVATDRKVAEVCNKYQVRKWFDIAADVGGGIMGRLGGLGM